MKPTSNRSPCPGRAFPAGCPLFETGMAGRLPGRPFRGLRAEFRPRRAELQASNGHVLLGLSHRFPGTDPLRAEFQDQWLCLQQQHQALCRTHPRCRHDPGFLSEQKGLDNRVDPFDDSPTAKFNMPQQASLFYAARSPATSGPSRSSPTAVSTTPSAWTTRTSAMRTTSTSGARRWCTGLPSITTRPSRMRGTPRRPGGSPSLPPRLP